MINKFLNKVDSLALELVEFTQDMIQTPSENPPGDEGEISKIVLERLENIGFETMIVEPESGRVNALGTLKGSGGGMNFLFNGHYDTVPVGNLEFWSVDPFGGLIKDGRIFGRGSADMKGAIASAVIAAKAIEKAGVRLKGNFMIHAVADEETFGRYGTRFLAEKGFVNSSMADLAVVGEGSVKDGRIFARTAVRGRMLVKISVKGKSAHSSRPKEGINAVLNMSRILLALENYDLHFQHHPLLPAPTIAPGTVIKGGTKDNVIPEKCEAICDLRLIPGMTVRGVLEEFRNLVEKIKEKDSDIVVEITSPLNKPPSEISTEEDIFKAAGRAVETIKGYNLRPIGTSGSNDTSWLTKIAKIPAMALGPSGGNAHGPDEWVSKDMLLDFAKIYGLMAIDICDIESI